MTKPPPTRTSSIRTETEDRIQLTGEQVLEALRAAGLVPKPAKEIRSTARSEEDEHVTMTLHSDQGPESDTDLLKGRYDLVVTVTRTKTVVGRVR